MEFVLITPQSAEWEYMWNWLAKHPINEGLDDPSTALHENEAWQYVGSFKEKTRVIHTFRHRNHPRNGKLQSVSVQASPDFKSDDVSREIKI